MQPKARAAVTRTFSVRSISIVLLILTMMRSVLSRDVQGRHLLSRSRVCFVATSQTQSRRRRRVLPACGAASPFTSSAAQPLGSRNCCSCTSTAPQWTTRHLKVSVSFPKNSRATVSLALSHQPEDYTNACNGLDDNLDSLQLRQQELQVEIRELNYGVGVNPKSHPQVCNSIYGPNRDLWGSTNKEALKTIANGESEQVADKRLHQLADRILQWRGVEARIKGLPPALASPSFSLSVAKAAAIAAEDASTHSLPSSAWQQTAPEFSHYDESVYQRYVETMFEPADYKMDSYWKEPLLQLSRPTARVLVEQLDPELCPLGFDRDAVPSVAGKKKIITVDSAKAVVVKEQRGTMLGFFREQKQKYPDCIILSRCGDFYETFGIDAVMMVEHCGLNAMGGKVKAGCPVINVQPTLEGLRAAGFRIAVFEEAADTDASAGAGAKGGSKSKLKHRYLAQIVSDASPTYLNGLRLCNNADTLAVAQDPRPYVGVLSKNSGYTLVEVSIEARTVQVSERLTPEAVACRLAAYPPADPFFYVPSSAEYESNNAIALPFHPSRKEMSRNGAGARLRTRTIPPRLLQEPSAGVGEVDIAKAAIVTELLKVTESIEEDQATGRRTTVDDFTLISSSNARRDETQTNPLYSETATQIGLMDDPAIPSLMSYVLPSSAPAATKRFLRRLLLTPAPPQVAEALRGVVMFMKESTPALPPFTVPPVGRVLALLRSGEASAEVYGEVLRALDTTMHMLDILENEPQVEEALMVLLAHETGLGADPMQVRDHCMNAVDEIEKVVSSIHHAGLSDDSSPLDDACSFGHWVPSDFFERNEASWRRRVQPSVLASAYAAVEDAAEELALVVARDFWLHPETETLGDTSREEDKSPVVFDKFNNLLVMDKLPRGLDEDLKQDYFHPVDRNGKRLDKRYTTPAVQSALSNYVTACDLAQEATSAALVALSEEVNEMHVQAVVQAAHSNLVLSSAFHHATKANALGWNMAEAYEPTAGESNPSVFNGVWPYWMQLASAKPNSFVLGGMVLLTAPNMSGKSTIMRSTATAAHLSACGLCAPLLPGSRIQRFDHLFVRGASSDVPTEQKSAFGAEMGDIAALLRCCKDKSLVFVDELGRGTSPRDGTRLAGAVLEAMAESGMSGFFATHLHDILDLPIRSDRIQKKRMAIHDSDHDDIYKWTYRLEDGVCTDSMALVTAKQFGVPESVLERAEAFWKDRPALSATDSAQVTPDEPDATVLDTEALRTRAQVIRIAERIIGQQGVLVAPKWEAPPYVEGMSTVYVLELDETPSRYYIGETDNFRQRLQTHRRKKGKWSNLTAIVYLVPEEEAGKSQARVLESRLIEKLSKEGVSLESTFDGRSVRSTRSASRSV